MQEFLRGDLIGQGLYPTVQFAGAPAAPPTVTATDEEGTGLGTVVRQVAEPEEGHFAATVDVRRRAMLLLKASFDPRWRVTVDGHQVDPQMIAPSYVGRESGRGGTRSSSSTCRTAPTGWCS